jgi:glycerol-3-phosphate cytidylyltransferase
VKRVITYGTFDLFHIGHLNLLERLRNLGDHLTVAVSTDEFNLRKEKVCSMSFADRARIVGALRCVDAVIAEESWEQKVDDIRTHGIALFGMGHDWSGRFDFLEPHCQVVYLPRTDGISTTSLKEQIGEKAINGGFRVKLAGSS